MKLAPALAFALAACPTVRAQSAPASPATAQASASTEKAPVAEVEYAIDLVREPALCARFRLACPAGPDGVTVLKVDESWGGVEKAGLALLDVAASGPSGEALRVERAGDDEWRVDSGSLPRISATWRVEPN